MEIELQLNGFSHDGITYVFSEFETESGIILHQVVSDSQVLVGTEDGIVMLDLSCTIAEKKCSTINEFISKLF